MSYSFRDDELTARNDAPIDKNKTEMEKLRPYILIAIVLVALAFLSTFIVDFVAKPGVCSSAYQQQNYNCIEQLAYATSNAQICSSLPSSYANQCYLSISENTKNESVCQRASDVNVSSECTMFIANATMDPGLCGNLQQDDMAECIDRIALEEGQPGLCTRLASENSSSLCLNAVYFNDAISNLNGSYCRLMTENNSMDTTFASLELAAESAKYNYVNITQVLDYAALANVSIGARDACYLSLAYVSGDKSYCAYASNATSTLCGTVAADFGTTSTANTTEAVNYTALMNSCTQAESYTQCNDTIGYMIAVGEKNLTKCGKLSTNYAYQCYYGLAQEFNNTSYCSYIKNYTLNNECVLSISSSYIANQSNDVG